MEQGKLKIAAKISLLAGIMAIIGQFVTIYQTSTQLVSPIIPKEMIWEISKQYIMVAFVFSINSLVGLVLYFYQKYLLVTILTILAFIASRFVYFL